MRLTIVGGGIGGLSCALALHREGMEATVYEQAPELREVGAALSLWPNATGVLERLGVLTALQPHAGVIREVHVRNAAGDPLLRTRVQGYPTPALCAHRADVQRVLLEALPSGTVELGRRFTRYEIRGGRARIHFEDGTGTETDLLIGADGLHSRVRAALLGEEPPVYQGYTIWRGVGRLPSTGRAGVATESMGEGLRFGVLDAGEGRAYWYATANRPEGERDRPEGRKAEVSRLFGGWHDPIPEVIESTPEASVLRNDAYDRAPRRGWHRGAVVLLGDAAHAMTPNLGQGGCMALEDAMVLAKCLASIPSPPDALGAYERERHGRTARIVRRSRWIGRLGAWTGMRAVLRDLITRATPARALERSLEDVYGYVPRPTRPR